MISAVLVRGGIIVLLASALGSSAAAGSVVPDPVLSVAWRAGRLGVTAERVPLTVVLEAVAREVGFEVVGLSGLDEPISVSFSDLSLEAGLRRLLGDISHVVIDDPLEAGGRRPTRVLVFGADRSREGGKVVVPAPASGDINVNRALDEPPSEPTQAERLATLRAAAEEGDEAPLRQAISDADPSIQGTAVELLANRDPWAATAAMVDATRGGPVAPRLGALHLLHQTGAPDDGGVVTALADALAAASDVTVKGYAIQALVARGGPVAWAALQRALADPDPGVRLAVVENAATAEEGRRLLQEALADADENVRSLAQFWLNQDRPTSP